jgi:4-hydroxyphenylpyruvate dioxygenase
MRRAIATVCLSGTLEEKLRAAAHAGFDGVEIFENDLIATPLSPTDVRALADDLGLSIDLYQPFRDYDSTDPATLDANRRRAERKFDVMDELGADLLLVCSNVSDDAVTDDAVLASQLNELAEHAASRGIRIAYEALAWGRHVNDYEHAWRIVEAGAHPQLGTCLDSFHILSSGSDPSGIRSIPGDRIFFLQLADAPHLVMDVLQWSRHYRCFPGQGGFDLRDFTGHVLAAGYAGPLSLEVFNDVFRQADPERMAVDALRSLLLLEDELGVRPLPGPRPLDGYEFVELAVESTTAPHVEDALTALGFHHVGPHRTKPVQMWAQNDVSVLLNHGDGGSGSPAGVTALAVSTDDPHGAAERAEALLAPVLERRRGAGEADLAAVAAPDGTSIFFCGGAEKTAPSRFFHDWRRDFVQVENGHHSELGVRRIDHVGLSQPFDYFDEAALFYRSVLGLEPGESTDLSAPDGLVRSRAVSDPAKSVRLALTVPRLGGSDLGPLTELQHVAFECDDVLAAARAIAEHGSVPLLAIPGNYYDDLGARIDLPADLLSELRELGVLYDRDSGGELLHVFTATIGERLFFELVERRGAYDGYGAANSAVRLAAQRRAGMSMGVT